MAITYKDKVNEELIWKRMSKKQDSFSKITDKNVIENTCKECTWCSTKLVLTDNKYEQEVLEELLTKQEITVEFDFVAKSKDAAINKFNKLGFAQTKEELKIPVKCKYIYEVLTTGSSNYRVRGSYEFGIGKSLQGYFLCKKDICPCCGYNIYQAEEKIEELKEKEYNKLIKKYKTKVEKENFEIDFSSFDVEGYLGTMVELYKDSYIIENQIKGLIAQKYLCKKSNKVIENEYINSNKDRKSKEYISVEKKLDKIYEKETREIVLSSSEKKALWVEFLANNDEWNVLSEVILQPVEPIKPEEPVAPKEPVSVKPGPFIFDESRLVKPNEPMYLQSNFFNKKKIEQQNEEMKNNYERRLGDYNRACSEYNQAKAKYNEDCSAVEKENLMAVEQYQRDVAVFDDNYASYLTSLKTYEIEVKKYEEKMAEYKSKVEKIEELTKKSSEIKKEIFEKAIEEKKIQMVDEKKELEKYKNDYLINQKNEIEREVLDLPSVIANDTMVAFLDDEVSKLLKDLFDVYSAIDELKAMNVIYYKYTEFAVLCTLYEYFQSGRCKELVGPQGAYNLYENESRADSIINKLDVINFKLDDIIDKLDEVKNSQVVLFKTMSEVKNEIEKANSGISKMAIEIGGIGTELKAIKHSAESQKLTNGDAQLSSTNHRALPVYSSNSVTSLPSYSSYSSYMNTQRMNFASTVKRASVIKRGIAGAIIAGPAGAIVGALSAVDHNRSL